MQLLSRKDAIDHGIAQYFTGEACKSGHIAPRYTKTCVCTECHKMNAIKSRIKFNMGQMGFRSFTTTAHPDDHKALLAYSVMLAAARNVQLPEVTIDNLQRFGQTTAPIASTPAQPTQSSAPAQPQATTVFVSPLQHKLDELARYQEQLAADKLKRAAYIPAEARAFTGDAN